ncbi:MAG: hypothetical protein M3177_00015 [Pseudomonadota bacterium]|nr:hypothetical protein [Pseudomonadota bacterium]
MKFALAALVLGATLGVLLPPDAFKDAFEGTLTFLGLVFASVVPAMALTVSTLRASRRSIREVRLLRRALESQLRFWMSFLAVTGIAAVLLVTASALDWPARELASFNVADTIITLTPMALFNAGILFLLLLVLGKSPAFARGMRDLLRLHLDQVEAESVAALQHEHQSVAGAIRDKHSEADPSFGRLLDEG